jgi:hypothetical protein
VEAPACEVGYSPPGSVGSEDEDGEVRHGSWRTGLR